MLWYSPRNCLAKCVSGQIRFVPSLRKHLPNTNGTRFHSMVAVAARIPTGIAENFPLPARSHTYQAICRSISQ